MQFKKRVLYSAVASAAGLVASLLLPLIPCRLSASTPNPSYQWTLCNLNPDNVLITLSRREYFGYTQSLMEAYVLTILLTFVVAMVVIHYATRRKKE